MPKEITQDGTAVPEDSTQPKYMTHDDFNKGINNRFGKFGAETNAKFEKLEALITQLLPADKRIDESQDQPTGNADLAKLQRELRKQREEMAKLQNQLASEKIHNELATELRGKVSETWVDVAINNLKQNAKVVNGATAIEIDGVPYSAAEAVQEWLQNPANKRFLPPPTTAKTQRNGTQPALVGRVGVSSDEERVAEYLRQHGIPDFIDE